MSEPIDTAPKGFLRRFRDLVADLGDCEDVRLESSVRLGDEKVRLPYPLPPLQLVLGGEDGKRLNLLPEATMTADGGSSHNGAYLLIDPEHYFEGINGFYRLGPGDAMTLGREDALQQDVLRYPRSVAESHLRIKFTDKGLVLKDRAPGHGTCLSPLSADSACNRLAEWRRGKLERLTRLLPVPLAPLPREDAMELILEVMKTMEREDRQAVDAEGRCGGLVVVPDELNAFFVGDLHARIDNLLVVLTQNGFLEALEEGTGALVFLGDAVHPDEEGEEERMDSSMLMMDILFLLKLAFPGRVFHLRGNHDSFSEDISKGGVPQGLLWEQALHEARGAKYARAMSSLYDMLPYVALSRGAVACHAGAPSSKVSRDMVVNIRQHPKLEYELTHVRLRKPNSPSGYGRGDVKRFRRSLEVDADAAFIVGHTPLSTDDTLWPEAGGIAHHHVVFGAHPGWVGVIAQVGSRLVPLRYPVEPLHSAFNRIAARDR
jgi:hypothetical protein